MPLSTIFLLYRGSFYLLIKEGFGVMPLERVTVQNKSSITVERQKCLQKINTMCGFALSCWTVNQVHSDTYVTKIVSLYLTAFNIPSTETKQNLSPYMAWLDLKSSHFPSTNQSFCWTQQSTNLVSGIW